MLVSVATCPKYDVAERTVPVFNVHALDDKVVVVDEAIVVQVASEYLLIVRTPVSPSHVIRRLVAEPVFTQ